MTGAKVRPTLAMDIAASSALALYSVAVAAGFARVFSGWDFLDNLIVLVVVGHGSALIFRRLRISAWFAVPATSLLMAWVLSAVHYRFTFSRGLPTSETWTLFTSEMQTVRDQFSTAVAPVLFGAGWDILAAIGLTIAVLLADIFAFQAFARAEALVPGGVLFIFIGALGSDRQRVPLTILLVAAGVVATIVLRAYHTPTRPATGRNRTSTRLILPSAVAATLVIALAAGFVGPRLPGADAAPIYETRGRGGGVSNVINPLVDIRSRLVNRGDNEMFVVTANIESYWRSSALPKFDGTTWGLPERELEDITQLPDARPGTEELRQQIRIVDLGGQLVPAAPDPTNVTSDRDDLLFSDETQTFMTVDGDLEKGDLFSITSAAPRFTQAQLANATSTDAGDPIYLELPEDLPSVVAETAAEVTAGTATPYEKALALQWWLREFDYSLAVQPGHGNSAIESFLRERVGYCEQFAGTYAAMLRTLDIPTRVAVGFTSGKQISEGVYSVLGKNAHAWPEVWFDDIGWVAFEPTPGRGSPSAENYTDVRPEQEPESTDDGAGATDTVPELEATVANDPFGDLGTPNLPEDVPATSGEFVEETPQNQGRLGQSLIVLLVVAIALALPAFVRWWRLRRKGDSNEQQLARLWRRSMLALEDAGVERVPSRTPLETAATTADHLPIAARPIKSLAEVVTEAAYRPTGTEGYDVVGSYGSSTIRDCGNWCRQIERAVQDTITIPERIRRYFTRWG